MDEQYFIRSYAVRFASRWFCSTGDSYHWNSICCNYWTS